MLPNQEPTNTDILEAINEFATKTEGRFNRIEQDVGAFKADVTTIKATMVDKDYLVRKLGSLKGDIILIMRKEDVKLRELVSILEEKHVLTKGEVQHILTMDPFPQLFV